MFYLLQASECISVHIKLTMPHERLHATAVPAKYAPDVEEYYDRPLHSDLIVAIREFGNPVDGTEAARADCTAGCELYGHVMVLVGNSGVWKAQVRLLQTSHQLCLVR